MGLFILTRLALNISSQECISPYTRVCALSGLYSSAKSVDDEKQFSDRSKDIADG